MINNDHPLLKKQRQVIPGTRIRLPSKAKFYKSGEVAKEVIDNNGELTIYPMTIQDDIVMRHRDSLIQGTAPEIVIRRCCPEILKSDELLAKDVEYILAELRIISHGDVVTVTTSCPDDTTETPKQFEYKLLVSDFIKKNKELNDNDVEKYKMTLKSSGIVIELSPIRHKDMLEHYQNDDNDKNTEDTKNDLIKLISAIIYSVDGFTEKDVIRAWLAELHIQDFNRIVSKYKSLSYFGLDINKKIECKLCKKEHEIAYSINPVSFFMPPAEVETE